MKEMRKKKGVGNYNHRYHPFSKGQPRCCLRPHSGDEMPPC